MIKSKIKVDWKLPEFIRTFQSDSSLKIFNNSTENQSNILLFKIAKRSFSLINQIHSNKVHQIYKNDHHLSGDAVFTFEPNIIVAVRTADCIPILLSNKQGSFVAAIHCGWKGLSNGIIYDTVKAVKINCEDIVAWIGPGISQNYFETDRDVFDLFMNKYNFLTRYFRYKNNKFNVDLIGIAISLLQHSGINKIYGNSISQDYCTFRDDFLYSYRQNNTPYRLISMAWIDL